MSASNGLTIRQAGYSEADFHACYAIRLAVFVAEQNVPLSAERDAHDESALHFLALCRGKPVGTARVLMQDAEQTAKITRVAVLQAARGLGIGAALMRHIEQAVPAKHFKLDAQLQALSFYERLGYLAEGEVFMEAGIAHRRLAKSPARRRAAINNPSG